MPAVGLAGVNGGHDAGSIELCDAFKLRDVEQQSADDGFDVSLRAPCKAGADDLRLACDRLFGHAIHEYGRGGHEDDARDECDAQNRDEGSFLERFADSRLSRRRCRFIGHAELAATCAVDSNGRPAARVLFRKAHH